MATVPASAVTALTAPIRQYATKIEWLSWDETTVLGDYTAYATDGSLSIDVSKDVRRTFTLTLNNASGLFIPNGALTSMGVKVRLKRGIVTSTGTVFWSRGIFVISDPEADHKDGATKTVSLNGVDKWSLINGDLGGTLTVTTVIASGTNVADAIRALLPNETKFSFDVCTVTTPYDVTKEPGSTVADLVKELALIPSWEIFYDVDGYLRFRALLDPLQKTPVADLSVGGTYRNCFVDSAYKPTWSKIKNYWQVIGYSDSTTGITYTGSAQDNNPSSPTNTATPPTGIGLKASVLTDTNITTNDLCNQRGGYELRQNLRSIDVSDHSIIPLPFLNEGDVVVLQDVAAGIADANYEIQTITEPFNNDLMTLEVWKVKSIFEEVLHSDFNQGIGNWQQLGSGIVDIFGLGGAFVLRKTGYNDPSGGYCLLSKPASNFEIIVYTRRDATGSGNNHYAMVDASGNGYNMGLTYDGSNILYIKTRVAWVSTTIASVSFTPTLGQWYTLHFIKSGSNFSLDVFSGKTTDFSTPLASAVVNDSAYTVFDRFAALGGYDYFTALAIVRRLF